MLVYNMGLLLDAYCEWRCCPIAEKMWTNFKTHFSEAHHDYHLTQNTVQTDGYHSANNAMEGFVNDTVNDFTNLATATASNHTMMTELTKTNTKLLRQLATQATRLQALRVHRLRLHPIYSYCHRQHRMHWPFSSNELTL
jgi:hypothetical protein